MLRAGSQVYNSLAIDLFCGLGGWTEALLDEGWQVIGFDIEQHFERRVHGDYGYPAQLVLQDVLTLHGSQFRNTSLIVASPPCTEYSYMAMPWSRAKQIAAALREEVPFPEGYTGSVNIAQLNALFNACFRIQREACEASGRYIPMVVENVKGAQPWVGRAKANFGSYFLWGDVGVVSGKIVNPLHLSFGEYLKKPRRRGPKPAPPLTVDQFCDGCKLSGNAVGTLRWEDRPVVRLHDAIKTAEGGSWFSVENGGKPAARNDPTHRKKPDRANAVKLQPANEGSEEPQHNSTKNNGGSWFGIAHNTESGVGQNPVNGVATILCGCGYRFDASLGKYGCPNCNGDCAGHMAREGFKQRGSGADWFDNGLCRESSKSDSRKAASAMIAKIPYPLAQHIARIFKP